MITNSKKDLQEKTLEGIQFLAESYGIEIEGKNKQTLIYEILDVQSQQLHNQ